LSGKISYLLREGRGRLKLGCRGLKLLCPNPKLFFGDIGART
jgi:hypothetical protein